MAPLPAKSPPAKIASKARGNLRFNRIIRSKFGEGSVPSVILEVCPHKAFIKLIFSLPRLRVKIKKTKRIITN